MCAARPEGNRKRLSDLSLTGTDKLAASPEMTPVEASLADAPYSYRALVVERSYKVIYRFDQKKEEIIVVALWDCRQDPEILKKKTKRK